MNMTPDKHQGEGSVSSKDNSVNKKALLEELKERKEKYDGRFLPYSRGKVHALEELIDDIKNGNLI